MIDTQGAQVKERQLIQHKWKLSDAGRAMEHQVAQLPGREFTPDLTSDQEDEVVTHMIEADGIFAVEQLEKKLAIETQRAGLFAKCYGDPQQASWTFREAFPRVQDGIRLIRIYRERLAKLKARLSDSADVVDDPVPPNPKSEVEEIHEILLARAGDAYIAHLNVQLARASEELEVRLKTVLADIDTARAHHAKGLQFGHHGDDEAHDALWDRLAWLVWRRQDLEDKIARVTGDQTRALAVQAAAVAKVVKDAGGAEAVAASIRDAWLMSGNYWGDHPDAKAIEDQRRTIANLERQLGQLGGLDAPGAIADTLRADRAIASKALNLQAKSVDGVLKAKITTLVTDAIAGDEVSRATIEHAARTEPRAFRYSSMADALASAMFHRSPQGSELLSILLSCGLPFAG